jgi:hypothetical protein
MKPTDAEIRRIMSEMGKRGSKATMRNTSPERRSEIARKAAKAMWKKKRKRKGV